jgi:hypothetical protein
MNLSEKSFAHGKPLNHVADPNGVGGYMNGAPVAPVAGKKAS